MPDSYTTRNRLTKQEIGSNEATWGNILNDGVIALVDDSLDGQISLDVTLGNITLTQVNGGADQSRFRFIEILNTSAATRELILPNVQKLYKIKFVKSGTGSLVIRNSTDATGVTLSDSSEVEIRCDGSVTSLFSGGGLKSVNNLSDVASKSASRTNLEVYSKTEVDVAVDSAKLIGEIKIWPLATAPSKYVVCGGQELNRVTYASLFAILGVTYGAGNGSTTFNVPDLRGVFVRGWDNTRGLDPSRVFGSYQADELKAHTHRIGSASLIAASGTAFPYQGSGTGMETTSTGGTETRPKNVAMNYIMYTGV